MKGDSFFLHILGKCVVNTYFQGKCRFLGILQKHLINIGADTVSAEYPQSILVIASALNGPDKFAGKDTAFQLMLPSADSQDIRFIKAGIQALPIRLFPFFPLFGRSCAVRHPFYDQG